MTQLLAGIAIVGGPGLMAGAGIAAAVRRWRVLASLTLLVAIGLFYAVRRIQGDNGADEQSGVILAIAAFMNFVGWIVGLLIGKLTARFTSRGPVPGE